MFKVFDFYNKKSYTIDTEFKNIFIKDRIVQTRIYQQRRHERIISMPILGTCGTWAHTIPSSLFCDNNEKLGYGGLIV